MARSLTIIGKYFASIFHKFRELVSQGMAYQKFSGLDIPILAGTSSNAESFEEGPAVVEKSDLYIFKSYLYLNFS